MNEDGISSQIHDTYTEYDISFHTFGSAIVGQESWRIEIVNKQNRSIEVNNNDFVDHIEIYNAMALDLNNTYSASLEDESGNDTPLDAKAVYDNYTDRLVWDFHGVPQVPGVLTDTVSLLKTAVIKFTLDAPPTPPIEE